MTFNSSIQKSVIAAKRTALREITPSLKQAVSGLRCPEGWKAELYLDLGLPAEYWSVDFVLKGYAQFPSEEQIEQATLLVEVLMSEVDDERLMLTHNKRYNEPRWVGEPLTILYIIDIRLS